MANYFYILLIFTFSSITSLSFSQKNFLTFTGKISEGIKGLSGVQIIVKAEKKKRPQKVYSMSDGTFNMRLELNDEYLITYNKKGYHKKLVEISTKVDEKLQDEDFEPYKFNIMLLKIAEQINYDPEKPVAKIRYCTKEDTFDYDKDYKNIIN